MPQMSDSKASPRVLELEEKRHQAWLLRVSGKSFREIGATLGVSVRTAFEYIKHELSRMRADTSELAEDHVNLQLARLDRAMARLMPIIEEGDVELALEAIDRLDKIERRKSQLLGLDAPSKTELTGKDGGAIEVDHRDALLRKLAGLVAGEDTRGEAPDDTQSTH